MEIKIQKLTKLLSFALFACILVWAMITQVMYVRIVILVFAAVIGTVVFMKRKAPFQVDERGLHLYLAAAYGSFITTQCFLFLYEATQYMKTGKIDPLCSYTIAVLVVSFGVFQGILHQDEKING